MNVCAGYIRNHLKVSDKHHFLRYFRKLLKLELIASPPNISSYPILHHSTIVPCREIYETSPPYTSGVEGNSINLCGIVCINDQC